MVILNPQKLDLNKIMKSKNLIKNSIKKLNAYVPGEQVLDEDIIKLNTNENPYLPSPDVQDILSMIDISKLSRYPDPNCIELRKVIAELHNCNFNQVFVGNGSDEILALSIRAYLEKDESLGYLNPSYSLYPVLADIENINKIPITLNDSFIWDGKYNKLIKLLILTNPNAPTGISLTNDQINNLLDNFKGILLIDEAYADFSNKNFLHLINDYSNVIISRSLSKSYSLAGIRCGYCLGDKDLIEALYKIKDSYNIDYITQEIARVAILDQNTMKANVQAIRETRVILNEKLIEFGFNVFPSDTNFIWFKPVGISAEILFEKLRKKNILLRYFNNSDLTKDFLRVTVGTAPEVFKLIDAIKEIISGDIE